MRVPPLPAGPQPAAPKVDAELDLSAKLAQCDLLPPEARTVLVTEACPPQMVKARAGRGAWARSQFDLQRLVGSGKTSNVYRVRLAHLTQKRFGQA